MGPFGHLILYPDLSQSLMGFTLHIRTFGAAHPDPHVGSVVKAEVSHCLHVNPGVTEGVPVNNPVQNTSTSREISKYKTTSWTNCN